MNKQQKKKYRCLVFLFGFLLICLTVVLCVFLIKNFNKEDGNNSNGFFTHVSLSNDSEEYDIIKQDSIDSYTGIGQQRVSYKIGYFTTFTTSGPYTKTYLEYKQNGESPWRNNSYWNDDMEHNGCGITSMAIILSGYGKSDTPEDLREKYFPVMNYNTMSEEFLNSYQIETSPFYYDSDHLSQDYINEHLLSGRPILICVWTQPHENRWTTSSHYMVLLATDGEKMVYLSNPNGGRNDSKSSGWYEYEEIIPYIAKALFVESYQ